MRTSLLAVRRHDGTPAGWQRTGRGRAVLPLLLALVLSWASTAALAQKAGTGRALFTHNCARCHGLPPGLSMGVDAAAGEPGLIAAALGRVQRMSFLQDRISAQDMIDIAAWLAAPDTPSAAAGSDVERLLDWAEWRYQQTLQPRATTAPVAGFATRLYTGPGLYVGVADAQVWLYELARPEAGIQPLGPLSEWLARAAADGF